MSLAPFHDWDSKVPASLKSELQQISKGIQDGSIQTPTKSPVSYEQRSHVAAVRRDAAPLPHWR